MEKKPPTIQDKCGTYAGYKVHRKNDEQLCMPCREAMRAYRRQYSKAHPEKEAKWKNAYMSKPEKKAALNEYSRAWHQAKRNSPEAIQAREEKKRIREEKVKATAREKEAQKLLKQQLREKALEKALEERRLAREAKKNDPAILAQKKANQERAWELGRQRFITYNLEKGRLSQEKREKQWAIDNAKRVAREEERERKRLNKKLVKLIKKRMKYILSQQHGTVIGDYDRCKKNNGIACDKCKAIAAEYVRTKYKSDPKYKEAEKRWRKANPGKAYANKHRAKKYGVPSEYYTRQHIFKRDGYDCYICSTPTDPTAPHIQGQPGWEMYPHIEHVIPISKGGPDTKANVRVAHAKCNIDKGVELPY